MNIENFSLSDHADGNAGKLTVVGMFDTIQAVQFPVQHAHCCLAVRLRFQRSEDGPHQVRIALVNADGNPQQFRHEQRIEAKFGPGLDTGTANMVLNLNGLPFHAPGNYYWDLVIDGQLVSRLPLYVRQINPQQAAA